MVCLSLIASAIGLEGRASMLLGVLRVAASFSHACSALNHEAALVMVEDLVAWIHYKKKNWTYEFSTFCVLNSYVLILKKRTNTKTYEFSTLPYDFSTHTRKKN